MYKLKTIKMENQILSQIAGQTASEQMILPQQMTEAQQASVDELKEAMMVNQAVGVQDAATLAGMMRRMKPKQIVRDCKIPRNMKCPCGSGKKYKNCCLGNGRFEGTHTV